jgi:hypothetical protein
LVKVPFLHRLKAARALKHHLPDRADAAEVKAVGDDAVDADVADHEHPKPPVSFRFGSHEPSQQLHFLFCVGYNGGSDLTHIVTSVVVNFDSNRLLMEQENGDRQTGDFSEEFLIYMYGAVGLDMTETGEVDQKGKPVAQERPVT